MTNLTNKEIEVLKFWISETMNCMGGTNAEEVLDDNMSLIFPSEISKHTSLNKRSVGGVLASLSQKGFAFEGDMRDFDSFAGQFEWWLTEEGVHKAFELLEE